MAINAEINKILADRIFAIYSHSESVILQRVASRIKRGITETGWTEIKAGSVTKFRQEIESLVNDTTKLTKAQVAKSIVEAYHKGVKSAEADYGLPGTLLSDLHIPSSIQRLVLEMDNIITGTSFQILRSTMDTYRQIQATVAGGLLTGVETRKQIAQRMLNHLADNGIKSFIDKSGRKWEMAAYAEMATRTVAGRAALQGHVDRQTEAKRDLIIVSDHMGTCPVCAPWQGKVLSISGQTPGYTTLGEAKAAGLFHPNCVHTLTGYIPGLTETEVKWPYNPKQYEYEQQQRANERAIRKWKRREAVAITPQQQLLAKSKIKDYQGKQRELLEGYEKEFGATLRRKYDRESIKNREGKVGIEPPLFSGPTPRADKPVRKPRQTKSKETSPKDNVVVLPTPKTLEYLKRQQKMFTTALGRKEDATAKEVLEAAVKNSELRMRVPGQETLLKILNEGRFKNQFETGTSQGSLSHSSRKEATKNLFGAEVEKLLPHEFEVYGYLGDKDVLEDAVKGSDVSQYGNIIITFKRANLFSRTTFTIDDSLGPALRQRMVASKVDEVVPLNMREYDEQDIKVLANKSKDIGETKPSDIVKEAGVLYIEAQYHGGVTIDDIESITMAGTRWSSPEVFTDEVKEILRKKKIKMFSANKNSLAEIE